MNNALLYFGALLVVTLAALFAVPHFVDWNGYRGVFEEEATKVLGRDVRVGGAVNVRLLPTPFVSFEKVRLSDTTGHTGEPFVRAESFTMRLSGPALLRGVLEANQVELDKPVLSLALDNDGGGNWSSIQIRSGALPFVPKDVALRSVKINEGRVTLYNAQAKVIARADEINGDFSADSIRGPFNFKGTAKWSGAGREVRFATTEPDASGAFQVKSVVRDLSSSATYLLDAKIEDLSGKPSLKGNLTGTFPLLTMASGNTEAETVPVMDLKANVDASTSGAKFDDIALSVDNAAEPQLISGSATTKWGTAASELDIALASKWLDLDQLAGAGKSPATFSKVKHLGLSVLRTLAGNGKAVAKLDIEQVKLGGETTGSMRIDAERSGTAVSLRELRAGLPGGARLHLSGDLKDAAGAVSFAGSGFIHGTNLSRLLEWSAKSGTKLDINASGPFSAEGHVLIADNRFELTEASADISGHPFTGDVSVSGEDHRKVSVTLEGASLDTSELFPETVSTLESNLRRALGVSAPPTEKSDEDADPDASGNDSDISVRVLAGELKHRQATYRDVDITVGLEGDKMRIPSAKFTTAGGLIARIDARINTKGAASKGTLAYDFDARSQAAVRDLIDLSGLAGIVPAAKIARTNSVKAAGLLHLGRRGPETADVSVDGTIESARVQATAEFDGGLKAWRTAPSRTRMTARGPALASVLTAFGVATKRTAEASSHEAELVVASTGALSNGATAVADISAPGFDATLKGAVTVPKDVSVTLLANVDIKAADALDALAVAGLSAGDGAASTPLEGTFTVTREANVWTLTSHGIKAGNTDLKGTAKFAGKPGEPDTITAELEADTIAVDSLLSAVTQKPSPADAEGGSESAIWPDGLFNFTSLSPATGTITLSFGTLRLDSGIAVHDGAMKIALSPERIAVTHLSGTAAGGSVSGQLALSKAPAGTALNAELKIADAKLAQLASSAKGKATLDLKAEAKAQSPAGLMAVLNGDGSLKLEGAAVRAPAPTIAATLIDGIMSQKIANNADAIADEIEKAAHASKAKIGSRTLEIKIVDGVAKVAPFSIAAGRNSVTATTTADLINMALDSAWKLAAVVPPLPPLAEPLPEYTPRPPRAPLPPVSIVYTGKLGNLAALDMNVDAEEMQRDLTVQLMERNVDQLERTRLEDEYRSKRDRERREKAADEARLQAEKAAAEKAATEQNGAIEPPPVLPESAGTEAAAPPAPQSSEAGAPPDAAAPPSAAAPPETRAQSVPRPRPRPRPSREEAHRTPSDAIMRSLGGFP